MARKLMLTDTALRGMAPGEVLRDTEVNGLHVIRRKDVRSFYLYFRTKAGVERRPKLGDHEIITIASARANARAMLAQVAEGRDPIAERTAARGEPTMNDLWARCEREHWNRGRRWDREAKRIYHAHVEPRIGNTRVRAVRYAEVYGIHSALATTPVEANRAVSVVSKMLNLAERFEWRDHRSNPCGSVSRNRELKRRRFGTPVELAKIGALLEAEAAEAPLLKPEMAQDRTTGVAFLYILLYSGARPTEIERAHPSVLERVEHEGKTYGILRIDEAKTGQRNVFLPPQAMRWVDTLPKQSGPNATLTGRKMPRRLWNRVRAKAGCADLWARDARRTFAAAGLGIGVPIGVIGELYDHKSTQTTKIYAKLMEDPALAAVEAIGSKMESLLSPPTK